MPTVDQQSPIRVAQLIDSLNTGGGERVAVSLANGLPRHGYRSYLVSTRQGGPLEAAVSPEVEVYLGQRRSRWDLSGMRRLRTYLREERIHLVHTHSHHTAYLIRLLLAGRRSKPLHIVHDHAGNVIKSRKMAVYDGIILRHVDAYVAVSAELRARAQRLLPLPEDCCVWIPNGIELGDLAPPWQGRPTVVQVANLHHPKGHLTAMRAAALLRQEIADLHWVCVGQMGNAEDPYLKQVRALIDEYGLGETVSLLGLRSDVRSLLRQAHVGVLTSDDEGLPLAVLEYMSAGLPVMMTEVGQGPAILQESGAGRWVPPKSPEAFAKVLGELLREPAVRHQMGARGREYVEKHHGLDVMVTQVDALYRRVLARKPLLSRVTAGTPETEANSQTARETS